MIDDVAEAGPDASPPRKKGGRPKSDTIALTKQARDRFNRKVVQNIETLFDALLDAATKDGDVNAARPLIERSIPSRRGAPIHFPLRPLKTAQDCADVLTDLLSSVAEGQLTPDEASQLSGIVGRRAELMESADHLASASGRCINPTPLHVGTGAFDANVLSSRPTRGTGPGPLKIALEPKQYGAKVDAYYRTAPSS